MRSVPIEQLRIGDRIGRHVYASSERLPLLCAGVRVSPQYLQSLRRAGITAVWIDDALSEGIEPLEVLTESTRRRASAAISSAFRDVTRTVTGASPLSADTLVEIKDVAELIVSDISENIHSALALNDLANTDSYTLKHSLAVTTLGLALGVRLMVAHGWVDGVGRRRFDGIEDRLAALGVGLLLHDIGKLAVPPEILHKPAPLTDMEWAVMRTHPTAGVDILRSANNISPLSRAVVRSHHERWGGGGYPDGAAGDDIHPFARIAAVADVFDAITTDRVYRPAMSTHEGYTYIVSRSGRDFDPSVAEIFRHTIAPFPPGSSVRLSDGSTALVKEVRQGAVEQPIVRIVADAAGAGITPFDVDLTASTLAITGPAPQLLEVET